MAKTTEDIFAKLAELEGVRKKAVRSLLKERRKIDRQLGKLGHADEGGKGRKSKRRVCKTCGKPGHNSRTCPLGKAKAKA
jgi:hypothetical protein